MNAKDITGEAYHHTAGDVDTLHLLVSDLPPNPVLVNIGACFGTSALAMLEARPDAFIFSIDINACPQEPEHIRKAGLNTGRVVRILGPSQQAGLHWPYKADLVFVDGAHGYDAVCRDIQAWRRHVKPGGFLAFHDYGRALLPHVTRAVDDEMGKVEPLMQHGSILVYQL